MKPMDADRPPVPAFAATGVYKSYRLEKHVLPVLKGMSLEIQAGSWTCLVGPSGCGKTTLLQLLGCLDTPDRGEIRCLGTDYTGLSEAGRSRLRRERIGFVFQSFNLFPELDALENVALPGLLPGRDRRLVCRRAGELLKACGLGERLRHRPCELSGGEQQRVAIARALINDPAIILADEPTGNLDQASGAGVIEILCRLQREEEKTLVMVTHDRGLARQADRVFVMADGRLQDRQEEAHATVS